MGQQPLGGAGIEIVQLFPMEGMAGVVIKMQVSAGNGGGDFFTHPFRGKGVVFSADDEGGDGDVFELANRIVSDGGSALGLGSVEGLGRGIGGGIFEALLHVVPAVIVVEPWLGEDEHLNPLHEIFWAHGGLGFHEVLPGVESEAVLPCPGAHEDEALDFFGVTKSELLGDDGAEGAADDAGLLDAELVHQAGVVVGHHGAGVGAFWFVGQADAAVVAQDAAEVLFPGLSVGIPDAAGGGDAHDADKRFTAAAFFVVHLDSVGGNVGHGL